MKPAQMKNAEMVAELLGVLAHPLRLMIVCLLLKREMYALELNEQLGTTKGNISQHLRLLLQRRLLKKRRDGNRIFFSIADAHLATLMKNVKALYCRDLEI